MKNGTERRMDVALWFGAMFGCYAAMPQSEKDALHEWEKQNLDGIVATSNWPGWDKYIGQHRPASFEVASRTEKKPIIGPVRMEVFSRDGFRCKKCGSMDRLTIDHVIPESKGGSHDISNFQTLCRSCNSKKGAKL